MTTATDPAHWAETLTKEAVTPFLEGRFSPNLGRKTYHWIRGQLFPEGIGDHSHAEEIFDRALSDAYAYLHRHGGDKVRHPDSWFYAICRNATTRYLIELSPNLPLEALIEGDKSYIQLQHVQNASRSQEQMFQELLETMEKLSPRHREFLRLDICECLPPNEIQQRMGIRSANYFRRLKSEAFKALRIAYKAALAHGIDSLF